MVKKCILMIFFTILFVAFGMSSASATAYLYDWAFNVDGTTYEAWLGDTMPTTGSLDSEGFGTLSWSTSSAGVHNFIAFFDHEIDEATNTFFNEYGSANGTPAAGQSWEIDEPGYVFGDIYNHVLGGSLDNFNNVPSGLEDDVSMAMGWNVSLAAGQTATIDLTLGRSAPASGFYLGHTDPDSNETIYFSSTLGIGGVSVPDAGILLLLSTALGGLGALEIKKLFMKKTT